jgi:alkaline phosphatase
MIRATTLILLLFARIVIYTGTISAQEGTPAEEGSSKYQKKHSYGQHDVTFSAVKAKRGAPRNVILLIGDGMGVSHVTAALVTNGNKLYMTSMPYTGLITTWSASDFITDSGAGGTALSTGKKTYNSAIGVDTDTIPITNIREVFAAQGKATGVIATSSITHATPAAFVAHQRDREMHYEIAMDFVGSGIDLFIGGGLRYFIERPDSLNLIAQLEARGYFVDTSTTDASPKPAFYRSDQNTPVAGLYALKHMQPAHSGRGNFLAAATANAITFLSQRSKKGFFLMAEGSQIDWAGHDKITEYLISETIDFDQAVGEALKFAEKDGRTLVIVTADHETGGFSLTGGSLYTGWIKGSFTSGDHTAAMVPLFAYGPGAHLFAGTYDITEVVSKILQATKSKGATK